MCSPNLDRHSSSRSYFFGRFLSSKYFRERKTLRNFCSKTLDWKPFKIRFSCQSVIFSIYGDNQNSRVNSQSRGWSYDSLLKELDHLTGEDFLLNDSFLLDRLNFYRTRFLILQHSEMFDIVTEAIMLNFFQTLKHHRITINSTKNIQKNEHLHFQPCVGHMYILCRK